ncbi:hypothetical protein SAMN04488591_1275 [Microbacterium azadirachtae]|uniref:Uncharacterized protein n=1 Tax=Microbacterium azadirachtae TaxID=582680 RepID=A0A1I6GJN1_9MICO|nr:hypothetical protein SAMN04488591_1275 [Microbacterium azadirachtae]
MLAVIAIFVTALVPVTISAGSAAASQKVVAHTATTTGSAPSSMRPMTLAGFQAGNIISDAVFTNNSTMSAQQIQDFFNAKVPSCQSGYTCLKDFRVTSQNRPADGYCSGYTGVANESAASIIYRVSQSCNINPQVLIVMLQKEQGLVTHTWPSSWRYDSALGQGCPDDAPCDPSYVGFFQQIYGAARQMQIYMEGRWFTWYAPGNTWSILYNPNQACGSGPVFVSNKATAALYYYTPYQPNAAALAAGYGEGDGCSAYGNRNFYNYFTDWFGSTQSSAPSAAAQVLQDSTSGKVYLVTGTVKYLFSTAERAVQFTWVSARRVVSSSDLAKYSDAGTVPRAVRTDAGNVYLLDSGRKIWVPSCALATDYGWACGSLPLVAQAQVNIYPDGGTLQPTVSALGSSWLIQSGSRREIVDRSILAQYGMSTGIVTISDAMASEYSLGDPVFTPGIYKDSTGAMTALLQNGTAYKVSAQGQVPAIVSAAKRVTADSIARLRSGGTLPLAVRAGTQTYLLSVDGWMAVDAYGSAIRFADLPAGAVAGGPSAPAALGAHFVREQSGIQVFLVSGGTLQLVNADQQRWITATFGVRPDVRIVADSALGGIAAPAQRLVRATDGTAYLIDGTNRYRFRSCAQVADWGGDCTRLPTATASDLSQTTDKGTLELLVRQSGGATWLVQAGKRREVVEPGILAPYGIGSATTTVSTSLVEALAVGAPVLGSGVYTDGGSGMLLVNGAGAYRIPQSARLTGVTNVARQLTAPSFATIAARGDLPTRIYSDNRALLLTQQGWFQVDPAQYGGTKFFTAGDPGAWVGVPLAGTDGRPHFVRTVSSSQVYLMSGGSPQVIENDAARAWASSYFGLSGTVWVLADGTLQGLAVAPGMIWKSPDAKLMISDGTASFRLGTCSDVAAFGKTCATLPQADVSALGMRDSGPLAALLQGSSGNPWLIQSGQRREVPDPSILAIYGIGSTATAVSDALLKVLPIGDPVVAAGAYRSTAGAMRLMTSTGRVLDVPAAAQVDALKSAAKPLSDDSFAKLKPSGAIPVRAAYGGSVYLLSSQGWLPVSAANYRGLAFGDAPADVISAVPVAPPATAARFVREMTQPQVYLASGGLTPVSDADQAWISATYGVPPTVLIVADGALH